MKLRISSLSLLTLCLMLAAVPAAAQGIYNNGPINGNTDAWTINFGFIVSDTFTISTGNTTVTGLSFGAWLFPGDTLTSAEVVFTSMENGGTTYFDQVVSFTSSGCTMNQYGYNVCDETGMFHGPTLNNGTYWLNLENASVPSGDPVYWDENSGIGCTSPGCPSMPSENSLGTIESEAFTMLGYASSSTSTTTTGTVPEPGSLVLFATGFFGFTAFLRRKLF
ncbi:MAG: PEP-CTERM sorting domain-containing protein [Candidatus Korobacteraceae bacterium]|jgi:hypothetical protein